MGRYIKLAGSNFSAAGLPKVVNYSAAISRLPGLAAWFSASSDFVELAEDGTVSRWLDRAMVTTLEPVFPELTVTNGPALIKTPTGLPALKFLSKAQNGDNTQTPMAWSGDLPLSGYTQVLLCSMDTPTVGSTLIGGGTSANNGAHLMRYSNTTGLLSSTIIGSASSSASVSAAESYLRPSVYADSFSLTDMSVSLMVNGSVVTESTSQALVSDYAYSVLSGSSRTSFGFNSSAMTVYDVLYFDTDILSSADSTARDLINSYAKAKLGVGAT